MINPKLTALIDELAKEIQKDADILKYRNDRSSYYDDMDLMMLISEYNTIQQKLESNTADAKEKSDFAAKAEELQAQIFKNEIYKSLQESENKINRLLNIFNEKITSAITGEVAGGCDSGGCSGCSGC